MKKLSTFALTVVCLVACERSSSSFDPEETSSSKAVASPSTAPSHASLPAGDGLTAAPVYDLKMTLVDQDGKPVGLDVFAGHPVLISMFYGTCPYACPTLISDIKRLDRSLDPDTRENLRVLLVSFDPERDTPAKLADLARLHQLDKRRYKLAQAPQEQVRELAAVLGVKYRKLENGAFNHSSVIILLDRRGRPVARADGLNQPLEGLKQGLVRLDDS